MERRRSGGGTGPTSSSSSSHQRRRVVEGEEEEEEEEEVYNILPLHDLRADHDGVRFPEVRAVMAAIQNTEGLPSLPQEQWSRRTDLIKKMKKKKIKKMDILDWLQAFFGFQEDNVRNQREHIALLLVNYDMQMQGELGGGLTVGQLDSRIGQRLRKKVLKNYIEWCSFLNKPSNIKLFHGAQYSPSSTESNLQMELVYSCLYLLIWGEAANLRFMPECICYIFHNMAYDLDKLLSKNPFKDAAGDGADPVYRCKNGFLLHIITPIYDVVAAEAQLAHGGKAKHADWRNYDDMNEYFWSERCFTQLKWPPNRSSNYLVKPVSKGGGGGNNETRDGIRLMKTSKQKVGKTGFVEQRSLWNIYHSFDHLWTMLILFLQVMIVLGWEEQGVVWQGGQYRWAGLRKDVVARSLSIFISWSALRILQAILDAILQYPLVSRETKLTGIRLILKLLSASAWTATFSILYLRMWKQRDADKLWSGAANRRFYQFLEAVVVFLSPEILGITLLLVPWLQIAVERSKWTILHAITWWFQRREFVGRGLREDIWDNLKYSLFWLVVLATKFSFSYVFQILPMIEPSRQLLKLTDIHYKWHQFFKNSNYFLVVITWAPVILIYLMDLQIWYTVFSSVVGALVGLLSHLGEIRDMQQMRDRFSFFANAVSFNLMPEDALPVNERFLSNMWVCMTEAWKRFKIRYGLAGFDKKIEVGSVEAGRFTHIWNEIIVTLREEDLLSYREVELLEVPPPFGWNVSTVQWPCFLLLNEIHVAFGHAKEFEEKNNSSESDRALWKMISSNEYRRCAVIECYESLQHLLRRIVEEGSEEAGVIKGIFADLNQTISNGLFIKNYNLSKLEEVNKKVVALLDVLTPKKQEGENREEFILPTKEKVVKALQNLYDIVIRDLLKGTQFLQNSAGRLAVPMFSNAISLPDFNDTAFSYRLRRLHTLLSSKDTLSEVPKNLEVRRRLAFFCNSVFMKMPRAPAVERMLSFCVLTPYYEEEVKCGLAELSKENEDGISTLYYLQKIYPDEWDNFCDRVRHEHPEIVLPGDSKDPDGNKAIDWQSKEGSTERQLWASYRAQTLTRTVRGMMYYYKALQLLAYLESASEIDIQEGRELSASEARYREDLDAFGKRAQQQALAMVKFTYVVACQKYGEHKVAKKPELKAHAENIQYLMKKYEALRIAYYHEKKNKQTNSIKFCSVLVKYDPLLGKEVEIYRVQLPGKLIIGEGKPENQNHAIIFTRGEAIQTIDMNQDNYFEEALKARNLLQEFRKKYGLRHPQILGVREHVFTGSVSSLAWFMSAQETSFVTLGQRVLANPLKVRMHYGHPDIFDRVWFLSRGGISKASKIINISEDIYAGFNCTLRGGNVTHHEYIQAGKGRDVGINQIAVFEGKVAGGNAEQVMSRDVYRLGHRLDFFRMLSFYYTTVGFYISNLLIVITVYAFLWGRLYLALSGVEASIQEQGNALSNRALVASLNQQVLVQMGIFTALPMIIEHSLEHGFGSSIWSFLRMQMQLASVFFTFSMGTRAHYFGRTALHGGAKYQATGRGFVVMHQHFDDIYRLFSRSHFTKGVELILILIIYESYGSYSSNTVTYILLTFSSWFLALSWILAPFLFNPLGFDLQKTSNDFQLFLDWIWCEGAEVYEPEKRLTNAEATELKDKAKTMNPILSTETQEQKAEPEEEPKPDPKKKPSWEVWWKGEISHLESTGFWGKLIEIILSLRFFFFQYGLSYRLHIANNSTAFYVYILSWSYIIVALVLFIVLSKASTKYSVTQHLYYRSIQLLTFLTLLGTIILLLVFTNFTIGDLFTSILAFVPTGWGILSIALVFKTWIDETKVWPVFVRVARLYDLAIGISITIPIVALGWFPGFQEMQTRILFNDAFSRGLHITRILAGGKKQKADTDSKPKQASTPLDEKKRGSDKLG